jgi:hypothetical protein
MDINNAAASLSLRFVSGDDFVMDITSTETINTDTYTAKIYDIKENYIMDFGSTFKSTVVLTLTLTDTQTTSLFGNYEWYLDRVRGTETRTLINGTMEVVKK